MKDSDLMVAFNGCSDAITDLATKFDDVVSAATNLSGAFDIVGDYFATWAAGEIVPLLLADATIRLAVLSLVGRGGLTPLHYLAYAEGDLDFLADKFLNGLSVAQKITLLSKKDGNGLTPLHYAAMKGNSAVLSACLSGASADQITTLFAMQDTLGKAAPLHYAACSDIPTACFEASFFETLPSKNVAKILGTSDQLGLTFCDWLALKNQQDVLTMLLQKQNVPDRASLIFKVNKLGFSIFSLATVSADSFTYISSLVSPWSLDTVFDNAYAAAMGSYLFPERMD